MLYNCIQLISFGLLTMVINNFKFTKLIMLNKHSFFKYIFEHNPRVSNWRCFAYKKFTYIYTINNMNLIKLCDWYQKTREEKS